MKNSRNFWCKDNCKKVALECNNSKEFQNKYSGAYKASLKNGWFDEITKHFILIKKKNNYWNKFNCKVEALKYNNRSDFRIYSSGAYKSALKNNWLDDLCTHMKIKGNLYNRINYSYEFSDNHVYIGLTCDIKRRNYEHMTDKNSVVYQHILKTGVIPVFKFDLLKPVKEAQVIEILQINNYKIKNWIILNKANGGSLGKSNTKWNYEKTKEEALKYNTRLEFQKKSHTAYKFSLKNKILNDVCSHMIKNKKKSINKNPKPKFNYEKAKEEALKYNTKKEFYTYSRNIYHYCFRNKILNDVCSHMIKLK